jgi:hypothetical protein
MKDILANHTTVFRFIREILRAQVNRIGAALQTIVEMLEASGATYTLKNGQTELFKNKKRDLRKEWEDYTTEYHERRLDKLNDVLKEKIKVFEEKSTIITKLKRWHYNGIFSRKGPDQLNCGREKQNSVMKQNVDLLIDEYKKQPKVESELKLA